jgi:hypothetical protein
VNAVYDVLDQRAPSEELVAVVIGAGRRGFNVTRVATALGISADGLMTIQQRIDGSDLAGGGDGRSGSTTRHV